MGVLGGVNAPIFKGSNLKMGSENDHSLFQNTPFGAFLVAFFEKMFPKEVFFEGGIRAAKVTYLI